MRFLQTHTQAAYCGDSSKWCISGRDCPQRSSARRCSMFAHPSRRIRRTKKNQQHFELLCGSERLRRLYGRGRWAYLRCGVRGKARRDFQTGGAAERSACGRAHKGRSHGLLLARLVYQVQREGARGASGGRRPQLGGAGVLRGQVVTYPLRTPESQAEDLAATVVAKAAAVLHCRMLARP